MKTEQLILYRDFEEGDLLTDMVWLAENYADDFYNLSDKAGLLYDCMHRLLDMAGRYAFMEISGTAILQIFWSIRKTAIAAARKSVAAWKAA